MITIHELTEEDIMSMKDLLPDGWPYSEEAYMDGMTEEELKAAMSPEPEYEVGHSAFDTQEGGDHYSKLAIQPIEYCQRNELGTCESFVVKYVTRWKDKGGVQDLRKARHVLDLLIEMEEEV